MSLSDSITAALDYTPIGIFILRPDYTVCFWNACLEEWTGIPRGEMIDRMITDRFPHFADPLYRHRLEGVFAGGPPAIFSSQLHRYVIPARLRDGSLRIQHTTVTALPDGNGQDSNALFAIQDVTDVTRQAQEYRRLRDQALAEARERQRAEEAVRQYAAELEARNAELDAFAHTVAHDLKAPMNAVLGYAEFMLEYSIEPGAPEGKRYLTEISRSVYRMNNIIRELLLLSQVRKADVVREPFNMATIVDEAYTRLATVIEASQATVQVPEAWPTAIGYGPWLTEVWVNYLSNALKYGGQPPYIQLGADAPVPGVVRFWIKDNGRGLSPEECARLFTEFTRLDQVRAEGHGLGLSIVRRIVEKLGGEVGVESEPGHGSLFYFTLPAG